MDREIWVYTHEVYVKDESFTKYRKKYLVKVDLPEGLVYPIDTILDFGDGNKARIIRLTVNLRESLEIYEATALNKWN